MFVLLFLRTREAKVEHDKCGRANYRDGNKFILWSTIGSSIVLLGLIGFIYLQIQAILSFNAAHPRLMG